MKKTSLMAFTLSIGLLLASFTESEAVSIDFTSSAFSSAYGQSTFYYSPAGLTLSALPNGADLYWDSTDGFGVNGANSTTAYEWDEIEGVEQLHLHFDNPRQLNEIMITDLFYEPSNNSGAYWYLERGRYSFDHTTWSTFLADASQTPSPATNGELTISFSDHPIISDIWFSAPGWLNDKREDHEFSVAGVNVSTDVTQVPEPASLILLSAGFLGLAALRRKLS